MIERLKKCIAGYYLPQEYPCLLKLAKRLALSRPLEGLKVLVATPIFRNTITEYIALVAAGAEIILGYGGDLPYSREWLSKLQELGIKTVCNDEEPFEVDVVLDCAGLFSKWSSRYGYVELTRSGVGYYDGFEKAVFLVDSGKIKQIETVLGTGESYFRAMEQLCYTFEKGKRLVVFGSGKVGSGIIYQAIYRELIVTIVTVTAALDLNVWSGVDEIIDVSEHDKIEKAVLKADFMVMATGVKGAFEYVCSPVALEQSAVVCANMGVEDEFGVGVLPERIVEKKRAVNFILDEPTHLKYIDSTLALHLYGALYLVENFGVKGVILPPEDIEQELINITLRDGTIGNELLFISNNKLNNRKIVVSL